MRGLMQGTGIVESGHRPAEGSDSERFEYFTRQRRLDFIDQDVETMQLVFEIERRAQALKGEFIAQFARRLVRRIRSGSRDRRS